MAQTKPTIDPKEEMLWRADAALRQAELVPEAERKPWLTMAQRWRDMANSMHAEDRGISRR